MQQLGVIFAHSPSRISLPRYGSRVGLHIDLFGACSAFTRVAACTLALSPIRDTLIEGFSHFVTSMTAPIASGWSDCRVGLAPTGKRRLCTAHAKGGRCSSGTRPNVFCRKGDPHHRRNQPRSVSCYPHLPASKSATVRILPTELAGPSTQARRSRSPVTISSVFQPNLKNAIEIWSIE